MRFSLTLAACIGGATLLTVTACQAPEPTAEIKGTVVEKEYEPPKEQKKKVTKDKETYVIGKDGKRHSTKGTVTETPTITEPECYELDIETETGSVVETCDKAAYNVLDVGDTYDSSRNYNREDQ